MVQGYKNLEVWQASRMLVKTLYQLTDAFPTREIYGLTSQIRRAAISVSANIAEGYGRKSPAAYIQFLRIAKGSVNELETLLILSNDLGFADEAESVVEDLNKIGSMLTNLISRVDQTIVRENRITQGSVESRIDAVGIVDQGVVYDESFDQPSG
jgi:four helix bundle protein